MYLVENFQRAFIPSFPIARGLWKTACIPQQPEDANCAPSTSESEPKKTGLRLRLIY